MAQTRRSRATNSARPPRSWLDRIRCIGIAVGSGAIALVPACASEPKLTPPTPLHSPWGAERTWAVVPFSNESGVSTVDTAALADRFAVEADDVDGVSCLPVNRTIAAMRSAQIPVVRTEADAQQLIRVLGVDGLLVGTVTAYDPYRPLQLGVAVQLIQGKAARPAAVDLSELTLSTGDARTAPPPSNDDSPLQVSRVYDADNHDTMLKLADYASGRYVIKSGLRENVYTSSMEAYARFCAYDVIRSLLETEAARLGPRAEVVVVPAK